MQRAGGQVEKSYQGLCPRNFICPGIALFVVTCLGVTTLAEAGDVVGGVPVPKNSSAGSNCVNLSGLYALQGEGAPGYPASFRFRGHGFFLDEMLGLDLSAGERQQVAYVELIHVIPASVELLFRSTEGVITRKRISALTNSITCDQTKVYIRSSEMGYGEAVSGVVNITNTLSTNPDGSLTVKMAISGRTRTLLFSYQSRREEYSAIFGRIGGAPISQP